MSITLNSYLAIIVARNWNVFDMLNSDTSAMGRFLDVVWCELSVTMVTFAMGRAHIRYVISNQFFGAQGI